MAAPQDNIIESLEAEIIKLNTQLSDAEDKIAEMKKRLSEMGIKLYGGKLSVVIAPNKKGAKNITKNLLLNKAVKLIS